ncbi:two-partner secretion domain-containing protein [Phormidesmis sp. 146-33]
MLFPNSFLNLIDSIAFKNSGAMALMMVCFFASVARSQVIPDNTLPNSAIVTFDGQEYRITGGTIAGENLYQSFEEFSLLRGRSAYFDTDARTQTIISRVTEKPSLIDGLIRTNGSVNLFLLNPNGITFGDNAALEVGGSFFASTAPFLKFEDNSLFSAARTSEAPLLSVRLPIGIQRGVSLPEPLINRGNLTTGQNLDLIGGTIANTGNLSAGNQLTITALDKATFDNSTLSAFSDLAIVADAILLNSSTLSTTVLANQIRNAGNIWLKAGEIIISDSQLLTTVNQSAIGAAGKIQIDADRLQVRQQSILRSDSANVLTNSNTPTSGITINAKTVEILEKSELQTTTIGNGISSPLPNQGANAGAIEINATDEITIAKGSVLLTGTDLTATGNSGDITLSANSITLQDNVILFSVTSGSGNTGTVTLNAIDALRLDKFAVVGTSTGRGSTGIGGDLNVQAGSLLITEQSGLTAGTSGVRKSGNVNVQVAGTIALDNNSLITNFVTSAGQADGGNIDLSARSLSLGDRSLISTSVLGQFSIINDQGVLLQTISPGQGNAGDINLRLGDRLALSGGSTIASQTGPRVVGAGGDINISSALLSVADKSSIIAGTAGLGDGGNITIAADQIKLRDLPTPTNGIIGGTIASAVGSQAIGNGGNIMLTTDALSMHDQALVTTQSDGQGNAGNIRVTANTFEATNGAQFRTNTSGSGQAGDIYIAARDRIQLQGNGVVEPLAGVIASAIVRGRKISFQPPLTPQDGERITIPTSSGLLQTTAQKVSEIGTTQTGLFASTSASATGAGGNVFVETPQLTVNNQAIVSISNWGSGQGGTLVINSDNIAVNRGLLFASTLQGKGGRLSINTNNLTLDNSLMIATTDSFDGANVTLSIRDLLLMRRGSQITARGYDAGNGGNIDIRAGFIVAKTSENSDISANSFQGRGGTIRLNARSILGLTSRSQLTPFSDITASSDLGINGVVTIDTFPLDPSQGTNPLPNEIIDVTRDVIQTCAPRSRLNSFVTAGRGGLPPTPREGIQGAGWIDWRTEQTTTSTPSTIATPVPTPLIEATGWRIAPDGSVSLIATETSVSQSPINCQSAQSLGH